MQPKNIDLKETIKQTPVLSKSGVSPKYVSAVQNTRSQAVARIADRTASQHLWGSRDVIGNVTIW